MNGAGVSRCDRSPIVQSRPAIRSSARVDPVVRPLEEALEHPELVEDLHRRGVDRVAAEIAEEVGVLFEHADVAAGAGEQQAGHHPGGPAADDDQVRISIRVMTSCRYGRCSACTWQMTWPRMRGQGGDSRPPALKTACRRVQHSGFSDALVILGAAGIVIPAFARLRISPVIGFILVGMLAGPSGSAR